MLNYDAVGFKQVLLLLENILLGYKQYTIVNCTKTVIMRNTVK